MSTANTIRAVHLRRALLLFAIVLGMAALVASLSQPPGQRRADTTPREPRESGPPVATPGAAPRLPPTLSFDVAENESKRLRVGRAATLEVSVEEPGDVEIPGLGLTDPAEPVTPARFDVLPTRPGRYELIFMPASGAANEPAGSLVVTSEG
jgi:hypothetical protein